MLRTTVATSSIDAALSEYLHATLGVAVQISAWAGAGALPYVLREAFEVRGLKLFDRTILLALDRHADKPALAAVRTALDKLTELSGDACVYVTQSLASYERRRLIEQKVPFIVPGNQLYLPDLGIDLRQYFRKRPHSPEAALSPATQALLISALLREPWQEEWDPAQVVAHLGYTAMTLSRAVKELTAAGIATLHSRNRARRLRMPQPPAQTWERARSLLATPVKRRFWARPIAGFRPPRVRLAGVAALARYALFAEPQWPVYALSPQQLKEATHAGMATQVQTLTGSCEWQVWAYSPALVHNSATVDPLSLMLSLKDASDARLPDALDQLRALLPW
jgi:hypothetical protein